MNVHSLPPSPFSLLLASKSPRRRELLTALGIPFDVLAAPIEEKPLPAENPQTAALRICLEKHRAARAMQPKHSLILTADTVVSLGVAGSWRIFGKPTDEEELRCMLHSLAGREHLVCTAFTLSSLRMMRSQVVASRVWLRDFTEAEIQAYCASDVPYDKAGGYAIQDLHLQPVAKLVGSYSNVMGLPLEALTFALRAFGFTIPLLQELQHNLSPLMDGT